MLVIPARVGAGPSDDGEVVVGNFELWRFGYLDVLGPLMRRRDLSADWVGEEQDIGDDTSRQLHFHSMHRKEPNCHPSESGRKEYGGRPRPPYMSRSYGIGGL